MKNIKIIELSMLSLIIFCFIGLNFNCKGVDIKDSWTVKIKYNKLARKEIIPVRSIFRFANNYVFYINGEKKEEYKQKGNIVRIKTKIKGRKYVIRGKIIDKNTMKGEIKKIMTDDEIGTWTAKRK